jgi:hypothetical protein
MFISLRTISIIRNLKTKMRIVTLRLERAPRGPEYHLAEDDLDKSPTKILCGAVSECVPKLFHAKIVGTDCEECHQRAAEKNILHRYLPRFDPTEFLTSLLNKKVSRRVAEEVLDRVSARRIERLEYPELETHREELYLRTLLDTIIENIDPK